MPARSRLAVAGIACALVLAACADGGGEPPPPTPSARVTSSSPTPTHTPTPSPTRTGPLTTGPNTRPGETPPDFPASAKAHNVEGALDFAFYFFKALDWSIATNDPWLLQTASATTCSPCNAVVQQLTELLDRRRTLHGGRVSILEWGIATGRFSVTSERVVRVRARQDAEQVRDASSLVVDRFAAREDVSLVFLNWTARGWRVVDLGVQK